MTLWECLVWWVLLLLLNVTVVVVAATPTASLPGIAWQ